MPSTTELTFSHGSIAEDRQRLSEYFSGEGAPANDRWSSLWDAGNFLPWDRGCPNPVIVDALRQRQDVLGSSVFIQDPDTGQKRRKRALVPGCGRGYDVLLLASLGYDAYGLEVSSKAVDLCNEFAEAYKDNYPMKSKDIGAGKAKFIVGDFFKHNWLGDVEGGRFFELLYDSGFLCALHPSKRASWSLRYSELALRHPETRLICVEAPTYKEPSTGGPPFGVPPPVYVAHLGHPGTEQPYDDKGNIITEGVAGVESSGFQRITRWQLTKPPEVNKGADWLSVWKTRQRD